MRKLDKIIIGVLLGIIAFQFYNYDALKENRGLIKTNESYSLEDSKLIRQMEENQSRIIYILDPEHSKKWDW